MRKVRGSSRALRGIHRVHALETLDDDVAGLQLVVAFDLGFGHVGGAGDGVMEIVGVGGSDVGDVESA